MDALSGSAPGFAGACPKARKALLDTRPSGVLPPALRRSLRARLLHELHAMPFFLRTVFLLRDLEGWSTEEIAGCLDEDVSQVLRGLNEARMRVVAGLEGCLP